MLLSNTTVATASVSSADTTTKTMTKCHRIQRRCRQIQYHNGASLLPLSWPFSFATKTSSFYGLNKWLWTALLFGLLIVTASAIDENSKSSPASTVSSSLSTRDEIYIDDEGLDGSGRGGIHDDLEKDHDFSGSGFGPDDEDSDSDYHHNTHKHQTGKSNINKNIDDNEFITTSRNNNQNQNNIHQTSSNSGINNIHQGNTGFISSGSNTATSGNTGLNTIETNNHKEQFNSSTSFPTQNVSTTTITITTTTTPTISTTTTSTTISPNNINHTFQNIPVTQHQQNTSHIVPYLPDNNDNNNNNNNNNNANANANNNNERNEGKIISPPIQQHNDNDDFDIEEAEVGGGSILVGSGDGGFIDRNNDNDDDDHTGDVDEDDDTGGDELPDITKYPKHGIFDTDTPTKTDHGHSNSHDGDDFEEEETDPIDKHQPIDHDENDDDDDDDDNDRVSVHKTHSEDGTEIYTDITDESSTGLSSSTTEKRPGGINTQGGTNIHDLDTNSINSLPPETKIIEQTTGNEVLIMNANDDDRTASFFAQPGILAAVIGGAVVGLLCAILVVMFIVYRMRKKDEGSYALDEPKRSPAMNSYAKNATNREFYA